MKVEELTEIITEMFESRIEWGNTEFSDDIEKHIKKIKQAFKLFKKCEIIEKEVEKKNKNVPIPNLARRIKRGWHNDSE